MILCESQCKRTVMRSNCFVILDNFTGIFGLCWFTMLNLFAPMIFLNFKKCFERKVTYLENAIDNMNYLVFEMSFKV